MLRSFLRVESALGQFDCVTRNNLQGVVGATRLARNVVRDVSDREGDQTNIGCNSFHDSKKWLSWKVSQPPTHGCSETFQTRKRAKKREKNNERIAVRRLTYNLL